MLREAPFQPRQALDDRELRGVALDLTGRNAGRITRSDRVRHNVVNRWDESWRESERLRHDQNRGALSGTITNNSLR